MYFNWKIHTYLRHIDKWIITHACYILLTEYIKIRCCHCFRRISNESASFLMLKVNINRMSATEMTRHVLPVQRNIPVVLVNLMEAILSSVANGPITLSRVSRTERWRQWSVQSVTFIQFCESVRIKRLKVRTESFTNIQPFWARHSIQSILHGINTL
jgi:hypothetical protein